MVANEVHLSFHPTFPGRPVGGQHIDAEAVMVSERGRLRMQWHRHAWCDMTPDHSLRPVVDDRTGHPAEVREPAPVAVPEGGQIHAGGETAKRVPRMTQHHMERVHGRDADMGQQVALIAPVDLSLRTRDDLETTVQTAQRILVPVSEFGRDARPGLG
jgi:hypothetical protein